MNLYKVLLVEDELSLGRITSSALSLNDFDVTWAKDGEEAWALFQSANYDICVMDIMMPKLDGYSLARRIRAINQSVPLIFLSARTMTEDIVKGFELGGNDYLRKPFSIEELTIRMKSLLKAPVKVDQVTTNSGLFEHSNVLYDYDTMKLIVNGEVFMLTYKENEILQILIKNKGAIVKRSDVLLEIWGDDNYFNARSMDVFITKLRKYLSAATTMKIVNLRGIGYKFILE